MKRKLVLFMVTALVSSVGIISCSNNTTTPTEIYLSNLKKGNSDQALTHQCVPEYDLQFPIVDAFEIQLSEDKDDDGLPYKKITATVDTPSTQETVIFYEWLTDDFYRQHVRHTDWLNKSRDEFNAIGAEAGIKPSGKRHEYLDRSQLSQNEYCTEVYVIPSRLGN